MGCHFITTTSLCLNYLSIPFVVDRILKAIIRTGRLTKKDTPLVASVVRDAEKLNWRPGQLERRKRAIQTVLTARSAVWVDDDADDDMLRREIKSEDALFKRKGWNEVDSGFRLWGGGKMEAKASDDKFLESKGWNNVSISEVPLPCGKATRSLTYYVLW